jgi:hypothetical protein
VFPTPSCLSLASHSSLPSRLESGCRGSSPCQSAEDLPARRFTSGRRCWRKGSFAPVSNGSACAPCAPSFLAPRWLSWPREQTCRTCQCAEATRGRGELADGHPPVRGGVFAGPAIQTVATGSGRDRPLQMVPTCTCAATSLQAPLSVRRQPLRVPGARSLRVRCPRRPCPVGLCPTPRT